jgi:hypothetical protein
MPRVAGVLGVACLACRSADVDRGEPQEVPEVVRESAGDPGSWLNMNLPVEGAEVHHRPDRLLVSWRGGVAAEKVSSFAAVLEDHGWEATADLSTSGQLVRLYERDGREIVFSVAEEFQHVTLLLQDLTVPAAP